MIDVFYLALLLVVAVVFILFAVKTKDLLAVVLPLLFGFFVVALYGEWGGWYSWQHYQDKQAKSKQVQAILKQFKTPDVLIQKLKQKLDETPESARGWYLLGRLYASQNDWHAAHDSFQKAIRLRPHHERYIINDIYAQWMSNQRQFNSEIRRNLQSLLHSKPKQPDALALFAMDAYQQKNYRQAIASWQVLLSLAPSDSEASGALRKAIARAQRKL